MQVMKGNQWIEISDEWLFSPEPKKGNKMIEGAPKNKLRKIEIVNDTENDIDLSENVDLLFHKELLAQGTRITTKGIDPDAKQRRSAPYMPTEHIELPATKTKTKTKKKTAKKK